MTKELELANIEVKMGEISFWDNKDEAQKVLKRYQELKQEISKEAEVERGDVILNIFSGAGGDDAEDFTRMLFEMYKKWGDKNGFSFEVLDVTHNSVGGFRNISTLVKGKNAFKILKNETGVHRLIRNSPFNSKGLRQTSFSYVEILPDIKNGNDLAIKDADVEIEFTKSSGPGGQNVNKRETAVRLRHLPSGIVVSVQTERAQERNRELAYEMLYGKLFNLKIEEEKKRMEGFTGDFKKGSEIEWGSQRRTYTLHPYKLVKDHISNTETSDVESVLGGDLQIFLE